MSHRQAKNDSSARDAGPCNGAADNASRSTSEYGNNSPRPKPPTANKATVSLSPIQAIQTCVTMRSTAFARAWVSASASAPTRKESTSRRSTSPSNCRSAARASRETPLRGIAAGRRDNVVANAAGAAFIEESRRLRPRCQDFKPIVGHGDGMLPLCRQRMIARDHGPAIRQQARAGFARVDHRLDREGHALVQTHALLALAVVQHLRIFVVDAADAVAAVFAHHGKSMTLGVLLDGMADVAERRARTHLLDALHHRFESDRAQPPRQYGRLADEIHAAGV